MTQRYDCDFHVSSDMGSHVRTSSSHRRVPLRTLHAPPLRTLEATVLCVLFRSTAAGEAF